MHVHHAKRQNALTETWSRLFTIFFLNYTNFQFTSLRSQSVHYDLHSLLIK